MQKLILSLFLILSHFLTLFSHFCWICFSHLFSHVVLFSHFQHFLNISVSILWGGLGGTTNKKLQRPGDESVKPSNQVFNGAMWPSHQTTMHGEADYQVLWPFQCV